MIRWEIWVERFRILIYLGLFFLLGTLVLGPIVMIIGDILSILLSLLAIILALLGFHFEIISFINNSLHGLQSYIGDFLFSDRSALVGFLVFLVFLGVIGWVIASIRYKHSTQALEDDKHERWKRVWSDRKDT